MSTTFLSDLPPRIRFKAEDCLCAQDATGFGGDSTPEQLRAAADPRCLHCSGTGIETVEVDANPSLNLANANARALLGALRLGSDLCGGCSVAEARRGVMRARAGSLSAFTRELSVVYGKRSSSGNVVEFTGQLRSMDIGLDEQGLADRVDRFSNFVEAVAALGAKSINWG